MTKEVFAKVPEAEIKLTTPTPSPRLEGGVIFMPEGTQDTGRTATVIRSSHAENQASTRSNSAHAITEGQEVLGNHAGHNQSLASQIEARTDVPPIFQEAFEKPGDGRSASLSEQIEALKELEQVYPEDKLKALSVDERRSVEMLRQEIIRGKRVKSALESVQPDAMAVPIGAGAYADPRLLNIVNEINAEIADRTPRPPATGEAILPSGFINDQQQRIRELIDNRLVNQAEADRLLADLRGWAVETQRAERVRRGRGGYLPQDVSNEINTARSAGDRQRAVELIRAQIDKYSPEAVDFPDDLLEYAIEFQETREHIISKIIFKPYETTDTGRYHLNSLYTEPRLEKLLEATRTDRESYRQNPADTDAELAERAEERYKELLMLRTAAENFHTMNSLIVQGKLDDFVRGAELIQYKQFGAMQNIKGVGEVLRLYEQKYQELLARDKWIYSKSYEDIRKYVEETFHQMNEAGLVRSEYTGQRQAAGAADARILQKWEEEQALHVARAWFNITFRSAEKIGWGQVPSYEQKLKGPHGEQLYDRHGNPIIRPATGDSKQRYASFPLETAARMANFIQVLLWRFDVAPTRGGQQFLHMVKEEYKDFLVEEGHKRGTNRIKILGGMNVEEMEMSGATGFSGVYGSWRLENLAFPVLKTSIAVPGGGYMTVDEWLAANPLGEMKGQALANHLRPLFQNLDVGLGMWASSGKIKGADGYEARKVLWECIAEKNLPMMISYLQALRTQDDSDALSLEAILDASPGGSAHWGIQRNPRDGKLEFQKDADGHIGSPAWQALYKKIQLMHEAQVKRAMDPTFTPLDPNALIPRADEQVIINAIKARGRDLAGDLADIYFYQTPFLNDMPFEVLNTAGPGEEFFKRRLGSDTPSLYGAQRALGTITDNPVGIGKDEGLKQLKAYEAGMSGPNGTEDGQKRTFPVATAWLKTVMTSPGKRQMLIKSAFEALHKPTSLAQEWAGLEAESYDETETIHLLAEMNKQGSISHELYKQGRKKLHLSLAWLFWAIFRDVIVIAPVVVGKDIVEEMVESVGMGDDKH